MGHKYAEKNMFLTQNNPLTHCSNPIHLLYTKKVQICTTECVLIKGLKQSLWCQGVKSAIRAYQLWQLPGQGGWHQMGSVEVTAYVNFQAHYLFPTILLHEGLTTFHISAYNVAKKPKNPRKLWHGLHKFGSKMFEGSKEVSTTKRTYWHRQLHPHPAPKNVSIHIIKCEFLSHIP